MMKLHLAATALLTLLAALPFAACQRQTEEEKAWETATATDTSDSYRLYLDRYSKGTHADEAKDRLAVALLPSNDEDYRAATRDFVRSLYKSEEDALNAVVTRDMHALYIGFLEAYPETQQRDLIMRCLSEFRVYQVPYKYDELCTDDDLRKRFGCLDPKDFTQWKSGTTGFTDEGGRKWSYGPYAIGNIQVLDGSFAYATNPNGVVFRKGSKIIHKKTSG